MQIVNCTSSKCVYLPGASVVGTAVEARRTAKITFVAVIPDSLGASASFLSSAVNAISFSSAVSTVTTSDSTYAAVVAPSADSITVSQAITTHQQASSSSDGLSGRNIAIVVFFVFLVVICLVVAIAVFFVLKGQKIDASSAKSGEAGLTKDASTDVEVVTVEFDGAKKDQEPEMHSSIN